MKQGRKAGPSNIPGVKPIQGDERGEEEGRECAGGHHDVEEPQAGDFSVLINSDDNNEIIIKYT